MIVSVIVPTYNRPRELTCCLQSLFRQSRIPNEIIVADDGSSDETRDAINLFRESIHGRITIKHVWQADDGFQKPRILNESVRNSDGDYLVFIDGDCMAHRDFLHYHLLSAEPNTLCGGKRVDLGKQLSEVLLRDGLFVTQINVKMILDSITGDSRKIEESLVIRSKTIRNCLKLDHINDDGIRGCNFSLSKPLFFAIYGCDEDFLDGSIEDNDLGIRVLNSGGKLKSVRNLANVFHLWHKSSWSFNNEKYLHNKQILERRITLKEQSCNNGIIKPLTGFRA